MNIYKTVGPNFKTYYYYTNESETKEDVKGSIVFATGMEGTGALYDEIGEYLDYKGYAMYAIDEWKYGKTGEVGKDTFKNWKRKDTYYAAYNIHALCTIAKKNHPNAPVYLVANDFGAMLSLVTIKEFPDVIDKLVTIGWGMPRIQDYGFLFTSFIRKIFFFDGNPCKSGHFGKNKRLALHFESKEKYAWLTSDTDQLRKIKSAGYLDRPGTVGHYFFYYARKIRTPIFMMHHKADKKMPILFMSGAQDLLTKKGRKTKALANFYRFKRYENVDLFITSGRHQLLFEKNRYETIDLILNWLETSEMPQKEKVEKKTTTPIKRAKEEITEVEVVGKNNFEFEDTTPHNEVIEVQEKPEEKFNELQEADENLLIKRHKESK